MFTNGIKCDSKGFNANGYNLTGGGEGTRGRKLSEYHKKNIGKKNSKEIWAYDYKNNHYIKGDSCKDISNKLLNMGHNISTQKIYDAISRKTQCENFTFGHTPQDAEKISNTIKLPKNIEFYLYNYKTKEYSNKFTSFTDGENYIRQSGCELSNGHLYTAILNDNKYVNLFFGLNRNEKDTFVFSLPLCGSFFRSSSENEGCVCTIT